MKLKSMFIPRRIIEERLREFLVEDLGEGDVTASAIIAHDLKVKAEIVAKQEGIVAGIEESIILAELMATPVFWLEFVAYSIAMAGSIWLFRRILQQRLSELKWTALSIGISALLLIIGAFVEVWLINAASL
jgi:hypothetical protein